MIFQCFDDDDDDDYYYCFIHIIPMLRGAAEERVHSWGAKEGEEPRCLLHLLARCGHLHFRASMSE